MTFMQEYKSFAGMIEMWAQKNDIFCKDINNLTKENQTAQRSWRKTDPKYHYNSEEDYCR